jgi:hypothetical protein
MQQRTRNGTRTHYRRVVQDSDAYARKREGKIKALAPKRAKSLSAHPRFVASRNGIVAKELQCPPRLTNEVGVLR